MPENLTKGKINLRIKVFTFLLYRKVSNIQK